MCRSTLFSVRVPDDLASQFKQTALEDDRSVSSAIRRAMRQYIDGTSAERVPMSSERGRA